MGIIGLKVLRYGGFGMAALFAISFVVGVATGDAHATKVLNSLAVVIGGFLPLAAALLIAVAAGRRLKRSTSADEPYLSKPTISDRAVGAIGVALLLVAGFVFIFRFETTSAGKGIAYRTDRLTGESVFLAGPREMKVERQRQQKFTDEESSN